MLKLIIPRDLLLFIDSNRGVYSRPTFILKCINYIMVNEININNTNLNNEGLNEESKGSVR